jgi:hypothetical protein
MGGLSGKLFVAITILTLMVCVAAFSAGQTSVLAGILILCSGAFLLSYVGQLAHKGDQSE